METVFDHDLTSDEVADYGFLESFSLELRHGLEFPDPLTEQGYRDTITPEASLFDLGLLYYHRENNAKAEFYWQHVADQALQYKLGFDWVIIPTDEV